MEEEEAPLPVEEVNKGDIVEEAVPDPVPVPAPVVVADQHYLYTRSPSSKTGSEGDGNGEEEEVEEDESREVEVPRSELEAVLVAPEDTGTETDDVAKLKSKINQWLEDCPNTDLNDPFSAAEGDINTVTAGGPAAAKEEPCDIDDDVNRDEDGESMKEGFDPETEEGHEGPGNTFRLFVSNLPPGFQSSVLRQLFQQYGEVVDCEVFAKNYAFVHMTSEETGLQAMLELNGMEIRGCKINVKKSVQTGNDSRSSVPQPHKTIIGELLEAGTFKIFISNFFQEVSKDYVEKLLEEEECGRVVEVEIFRNNSAFVHMESEEGGWKAIEKLHGKIIVDSDSGIEKPLHVTESKNPRGPSIATMTLKVSNVACSITAAELRDLFTPYGLVLGVKIFARRCHEYGGNHTALVNFEQYGNIRSAIKDLSGKEVHGFKLLVEASFDNKPTTPQYNRPISFNQEDTGWQGSNFPPIHRPHPPQRFRPPFAPAPGPRMRLIPMPSQAELRRMPRGNRGRILLGQPPPRPLLMYQQRMPHPPGFPSGRGGFNNGFQYGGANQDFTYDEDEGFEGQSYNSSNFESEEYDCDYSGDNECYTPPVKRQRESVESWNSVGTSNNFTQKFNGNSGNGQGQGNSNMNPFPNLPTPKEFPEAVPPPSLMSMQMQIPNSNSAENCDWSADLPLSSFADFSAGGGQDFANDEPTAAPSTHAVPFDYSQMKQRKQRPQQQKQNFPRNNFQPNRFPQQNRKNFGGKMGKAKKGKPKRPGLGSELQQKKFAVQAGVDEAVPSPNFEPVQVVQQQPQANQNQGAVASTGGNESTSANPYTPYYFQQNWSLQEIASRQRQNREKRQSNKPTPQQIKAAEEEQKRQYADYLKQKPWLYQAIPGTVKRVDK